MVAPILQLWHQQSVGAVQAQFRLFESQASQNPSEVHCLRQDEHRKSLPHLPGRVPCCPPQERQTPLAVSNRLQQTGNDNTMIWTEYVLQAFLCTLKNS